MRLRSENNLLFSQKDLGVLIHAYEKMVREKVDSWGRNKILSVSEHDLVACLVEEFMLDSPRVLRDKIYIEKYGETQIDVSHRFEYATFGEGPHYVTGDSLTVGIPFEGDGDLFQFRASSFSFNPPRGYVKGATVFISFENVTLDPEQVKQDIENIVNNIEEYLAWIRNDCDGWNGRIQGLAEQCIQERKQRLLKQAGMVSSLGLPMKRDEAFAEASAIPIRRKRRPVVVSQTPNKEFKPEPLLPDNEYDYILDVIDRLSLMIERSPTTFVNMKEEEIRNIFLVHLNGHYENEVAGETFNAHGKTDILIRAAERNVFIAECKFWTGAKAMSAAVNQILRYLTWRDTKATLIIFSKRKEFTKILKKIADVICQHPNFKRELRILSETHTRYLFRQKNDAERDLYLAVQVFNIPDGKE